jgi:hypothetical protein
MICAQVGEDSALSSPATVDLSKLLAQHVINITELSLTAAQYKAHMKPPVAWMEGPLLGVPSAEDGGQSIKHHANASRNPPPAVDGDTWHSAFNNGAASSVDQCYAVRASAAAGQPASRWINNLPQQVEQAGIDEEVQQQNQASSSLRHLHMQSAAAHQAEQQDMSVEAHFAVQEVTYNIWDHSGDRLPVVELFPMEIRTFEIMLPENV